MGNSKGIVKRPKIETIDAAKLDNLSDLYQNIGCDMNWVIKTI